MLGVARCALPLLLLVACAGSPRTTPESPGPPGRVPSDGISPETAFAALKGSDYESAEAMFRALLEEARPAPTPVQERIERGALRRGLFQVLVSTGRYEEAVALPLAAEGDPEDAFLLAEALRDQGQLDAARAVLVRAPGTGAAAVRLRLALVEAEILLERGKRGEAEPLLLERVIAAYSDGSLDDLSERDRGDALTSIGRAAHLLRAPKDANQAFNEAEELGHATPRLLLARGELFLEKYDTAHGTEVVRDLLEVAPNHASGLVLLARILLAERLALEEARVLCERALSIDSGHPGAHFVLASIALRDLAFQQTESHIRAGLARNPADLELLSLRAAARFLAEDPDGTQAALDRVLELNPTYSRALAIVSDHAEWEHRYADMELLLRRAVRIDPEDGRSRGELGLTLVRAGSDSAGVVELRRAFSDDPFNVRVKNTLELYEDIIPKSYVEKRHGPFQLRMPKSDAELLLRYVPDLLDRAHDAMQERYGYRPVAPLSIEIYATREQFAVRTSGLPQTPIQGVCFGRKLATVSPTGSSGNLGMTLWHELGHVFHIGLSESRVPRWLTEGLAEWETEHLGRGWSRELDLELYQAHQAEALPKIGSMTHAFTHAKRMEDIATAYYASGRIAKFLIETRGERKVAEVLAVLGEKRLPDDALPRALGISLAALDEEFRAWLEQDLARYPAQFVSRTTRRSVLAVKKALALDKGDGGLRTELGQALLQAGEVAPAKEILAAQSGRDPQAAFALARIFVAEGALDDAARTLETDLLEAGHDGFEVRMLLGQARFKQDQPEAARVHLERAVELDATQVEPLMLLATIHHQAARPAAELAALQAWTRLSEHDGAAHRRYLTLLLERGELDAARAALDDALWAALGDPEMHRLAARVHDRSGDLSRAEFEWESALLCPTRPGEKKSIAEEWVTALRQRGQVARARAVEQRYLTPSP